MTTKKARLAQNAFFNLVLTKMIKMCLLFIDDQLCCSSTLKVYFDPFLKFGPHCTEASLKQKKLEDPFT